MSKSFPGRSRRLETLPVLMRHSKRALPKNLPSVEWHQWLVQQYVWHTHICSGLKVSGPGSIVPPTARRC